MLKPWAAFALARSGGTTLTREPFGSSVFETIDSIRTG
jgi:hypothetical protein